MPTDARTVLIVDDHPAFRASARRLLESEGYRVVAEAGDGQSAIAAARQHLPDVVLLDVQLPDIDGFDVATEIEAGLDAATALPRIVLVSSREASDFGQLVERSCACGFITKGELSGSKLTELLP